jgi:hypothetical protein
LVEETGAPRENNQTVESHLQTLLHNVIHLALIKIRTHKISSDKSTSLNDGQTTSTIMPHKVLIFEHKIFDFHVNLQACTPGFDTNLVQIYRLFAIIIITVILECNSHKIKIHVY